MRSLIRFLCGSSCYKLINNFEISGNWLRAVALVNDIEVSTVRKVVTHQRDTLVRLTIEEDIDVVIVFSFIHKCSGAVIDPYNVIREFFETLDQERIVHTIAVSRDTIERSDIRFQFDRHTGFTTFRRSYRDKVI